MSAAPCEICHGRGDYEVPDGKLVECRCQVLRRACASMPRHILVSNIMDGHIAAGLHNRADQCLFIRAAWADMKPIIKAAMFKWFGRKVFRITSDREIRDVYVGSKSKAAARDEDQVVYNNLQDLMEPIIEKPGDRPPLGAPKRDLVIVRLNELHYKNKAAPGALEEALQIRTDRDRPTWVVSDPDSPFGPGSHAFSEAVWEMLTSPVFRGVDIPRITPRATEQQQVQAARAPLVGQREETAPPPDPDPPRRAPEERQRKIRPADDDAPFGLGSMGQGLGRKGGFRGRS